MAISRETAAEYIDLLNAVVDALDEARYYAAEHEMRRVALDDLDLMWTAELLADDPQDAENLVMAAILSGRSVATGNEAEATQALVDDAVGVFSELSDVCCNCGDDDGPYRVCLDCLERLA